jgi:hypothetical protein
MSHFSGEIRFGDELSESLPSLCEQSTFQINDMLTDFGHEFCGEQARIFTPTLSVHYSESV